MRTVYALLALAIGLIVPLQAAVNNQLKITIGGSTVMAALVSFACGTVTLALVALLVVAAGCSTSSGSRDYIPGKGWVPND